MTKFHKDFVSPKYVGHRQYKEPREVIDYVVAKSATQRVLM